MATARAVPRSTSFDVPGTEPFLSGAQQPLLERAHSSDTATIALEPSSSAAARHRNMAAFFHAQRARSATQTVMEMSVDAAQRAIDTGDLKIDDGATGGVLETWQSLPPPDLLRAIQMRRQTSLEGGASLRAAPDMASFDSTMTEAIEEKESVRATRASIDKAIEMEDERAAASCCPSLCSDSSSDDAPNSVDVLARSSVASSRWHLFRSRLPYYIPILQWLPNYSRDDLSSDVRSGLNVGVVGLVASIPYANLARTDPLHAIYGGIFPSLVYCILGSSKRMNFGSLFEDFSFPSFLSRSASTLDSATYIYSTRLVMCSRGRHHQAPRPSRPRYSGACSMNCPPPSSWRTRTACTEHCRSSLVCSRSVSAYCVSAT